MPATSRALRAAAAGIVLGPLACGGAPAPRANVVLVTLDTVRADHLGVYGHAGARTPFLDRLAAAGTRFETALSVAPITMPTHSSILTGLYPQHHGVRSNGGFALGAAHHTLAEQLAEQGYDTAAVVSAYVLDSKFGLDQGFRVYDDDLSGGPRQKMFMFKEVPAGVSVDKALALLEDELTEPFFLWVHLFDAHADYEPPPPYDVLFRDQPYDGEIAYLDAQLARLDEGLTRLGHRDDTVMMVTADHGESLGDHGEQTHGIFVYRSTTQVPWIVRGPGVVPGVVGGVASQVDLAPTVLSWVGAPAMPTDGLDLSPSLARGADVPERGGVYAESLNPRFHFGWHELRAVDDGARTYVDAPTPELYDLTADPDQTDNLLPGADAAELEARLAALTADDDLDAVEAAPLDPETRGMLEALGYVADLGTVDPADRPDPKDVAHRWFDLQRCQALTRLRAHAEAIRCLSALLVDDPENWTARMSLAGTLRSVGRAEQALEVLQRALAADPDHTKALISLAATLDQLGRDDEATRALLRASNAAPADPEPWTVLGDFRLEDGDLDGTIDAYAEALRRDASAVEAYIGLASAFHRDGQHDRALRYTDEAIRLDPSRHAAWYNRGVVLDALGRLDEAEDAYREALARRPDHALTLNNLGSLLRRVGRSEEGIQAFRQALNVDPEHVEALYNLATSVLEDDPAGAIELFRRALDRRPSLVQARHNLALALRRTGDPSGALVQLQWLVDHLDRPVGPWLTMASIEAARGRRQVAKAHVARAVAAGGEPVVAQVRADPVLSALLP